MSEFEKSLEKVKILTKAKDEQMKEPQELSVTSDDESKNELPEKPQLDHSPKNNETQE